MKGIVLAITILLALFSSGCWDARDLGKTEIAIVSAHDLIREEEKTKEQDQIMISFLTPVMDKDAKEKSRIIKAAGETVGDARAVRANRYSTVTVTEIKSTLLGESLARQGLSDTLEVLYRNPFLSYQDNLAVVEGNAGDVLKPKTTVNIGETINSLLEEIPEQNFVPRVTLADFRKDVLNYGRNPVLPMLSKMGEDDVEISGLAVFKKDRMVGKFDQNQMKYLTLLRGEKANGVITYLLPGTEDVYVTLSGTNSRKVNVELTEDKAYINIDIFLVVDIIEVQKNYIFNENLERFQLTEEGARDYIVSKCGEVLAYLQNDYQVDALNIGAAARARYGKEIEFLDWDRLFAGSDITVNAQVKIRNYGAIK